MADARCSSGLEPELPKLIELYRHFHAHPELSLFEKETAAKLAAEWKAVGFEVTTRVGGAGVVALLNVAGPTLMLRTDLDGLPVVEQTGLAYASRVKVKDSAGRISAPSACLRSRHSYHGTRRRGSLLRRPQGSMEGNLMFIGQTGRGTQLPGK